VVDAILQLAGFGQIVDEHQLARLIRQRLGRQLNPAPIAQGNFVAVILAGLETAVDDLAPGLAFQRLPQQRLGGRVGAGDPALAVEQQDTGGQRREDGVKLAHLVRLERGILRLGCHKADLKLATESAYSISMPLKLIHI